MRYQDETPAREVTSSCQWDTQWSRESSSFTCTLTYCPKSLELPSTAATEEDQEWVKLGDGKKFNCPAGSRLNEATDTKEAANSSFTVACGDDGAFQVRQVWPTCLAGERRFGPGGHHSPPASGRV